MCHRKNFRYRSVSKSIALISERSGATGDSVCGYQTRTIPERSRKYSSTNSDEMLAIKFDQRHWTLAPYMYDYLGIYAGILANFLFMLDLSGD
jgi:hypothetical protein